jgi:hypothetical protein
MFPHHSKLFEGRERGREVREDEVCFPHVVVISTDLQGGGRKMFFLKFEVREKEIKRKREKPSTLQTQTKIIPEPTGPVTSKPLPEVTSKVISFAK